MHPILFSFGPLRVYSYGVLVAMGVLSAVLLLRSSARRLTLHPDVIVDLAIATVISGFVGARIFYVIQFWDQFQNAPLDAIKIWEGGIVVYGGMIGGLIGFLVFVRLRKLPFLSLLDMFVPALAFAQGFGRFGCFMNGCCFGKSTTLPWGISFPFLESQVHPTQLYEAAFCFALALFLLLFSRKKLSVGSVSAAYFILYPMGRFVIEFFRGDNARILMGLTLAQWISIGSIAVTLLLVFISKFSHGKKSLYRSA
ncbi:MAG: prolipoprotein diacylglyceryl transferase [Candidatus Omnitrophica bacterium]|nr:prolipoprotein diacylglyceryl transferase [Candidatus Omnitrophota bacterium]